MKVILWGLAALIFGTQCFAQQQEWEQSTLRARKLLESGQYAGGAEKLTEALAAAQAFGPDDVRLANTWTDLGIVDLALGRLHGAQHASGRAMQIYERIGIKDAKYARAVATSAAVYANWQQYGKARELAQRAVDIQTTVLPADHPDLAISLALSAFIDLNEKRYEDAEPLQRQALAILKKHPEGREAGIARALSSLGATLAGLKRCAEAEAVLQEALTLAETTVGSEHPLMGELLGSLGALRLRFHQDAEAAKLFARSLAIYEHTHGSDRPDLARISLGYAQALRRLHRKREAVKYEQRARAIQASRSAEDGRHTVDARTMVEISGR